MTQDEKDFNEILMTSTVVGSFDVAEMSRDYDYDYCGDNVIEITNKNTNVTHRIMVECLGMTVPS